MEQPTSRRPELVEYHQSPSLLTHDRSYEPAKLHDSFDHSKFIAYRLDQGLELEDFAESYDVSSASIFQLAWARVLACFTDSQITTFYFLTFDNAQPASTKCINAASPGTLSEQVQLIQEQSNRASGVEHDQMTTDTMLAIVEEAQLDKLDHQLPEVTYYPSFC
jgi:hypothetical protein